MGAGVGAPVADFDLLPPPLAGDNIDIDIDIDASDSSPLIVLRCRRRAFTWVAEAMMLRAKTMVVNFMMMIYGY